MNILAFGASTSKNSINKKFASFVARSIQSSNSAELKILDLNNFEMPIYSIDKENEIGIPEKARLFIADLEWADFIVISFAEHNGTYSAAFKNIFDWASRSKHKMFEDKKLILLSTSPGPRGGKTTLDTAMDRFPRHGGHILFSFSLPLFNENFDEELGIVNIELKAELESYISNVYT